MAMANKGMTEKEFETWFTKEIPEECHSLAKLLIKEYTAKIDQSVKQSIKDKNLIDTGYMLRSVTYEIQDNGWTGIVKVGAEYGIYVEFGTTTHRAKPFFYPASQQWMDRFLKVMEEAMGKSFE